MHKLVFVAVMLVAGRAGADASNRFFLPFGERASSMGNAGLCSPFGDAVFYNPANLTRIDHPSLSVSGSTYLRFDLSAHPLLVLQGQDQDFDASGFVAIPSTVVSTYKIGDWWLATAILVPEALDFKNRVTFTSAGVTATVLEQKQQESLWFGASIAHEIVPHLAVGLSLFGIRDKEAEISYTRAVQAMETFEETQNQDTAVYNLSAVLGVYWEPMPELGLALRLQSPTLRLAGSTDFYVASVDTGANGMPPMSTEQQVDGAKADRPLPTDISIGASVRPADGVELDADIGLQLPATITTLDDPVAGTNTQDLQLAPRASLGAELTVGEKKWIRLGLMYNQSAVVSPQTASDPSRDDYFGFTAGFAFAKERTMTSVGVFGMQSNTEIFVNGADPPRKSDAVIRLYGALLAFSYRL